MNVVELSGYRQRRSVRRLSAYAVATLGVVAAAAGLLRIRRDLEWSIRKAAELLPDVDEVAS